MMWLTLHFLVQNSACRFTGRALIEGVTEGAGQGYISTYKRGGWRKLSIRSFMSCTLVLTTSRRVKWVEYVTRMGKTRNSCKTSVEKIRRDDILVNLGRILKFIWEKRLLKLWIGLESGNDTMASFCEHDNELWGVTNAGHLLTRPTSFERPRVMQLVTY
jgi:hypothetical protein